jgi:hypothetical protein
MYVQRKNILPLNIHSCVFDYKPIIKVYRSVMTGFAIWHVIPFSLIVRCQNLEGKYCLSSELKCESECLVPIYGRDDVNRSCKRGFLYSH